MVFVVSLTELKSIFHLAKCHVAISCTYEVMMGQKCWKIYVKNAKFVYFVWKKTDKWME